MTASTTPNFANQGQEISDLATRIAWLEGRERVKELRAAYGWYAARGDRDGVAGLFHPDGAFELLYDGQRRRFEGRKAIRAFLETNMFPGMVFPLIHNDTIEIKGNVATGTCAMESRTKGTIAEKTSPFLGYYHDSAERRGDGRWLFTERRWFFYDPVFENSGLPLYQDAPRNR